MRKSLSILAALGIAFFAFSGTARADEPPTDPNGNKFSLHLEPGVVFPLTDPQSNLYNPGMALGAKGLFALTPNLAVGPSLSTIYVPRSPDDNRNAGTLWQFGGSARLQTDRRNTTKGLFSVVNPWVDVDLSWGITGNLHRPTGDIGAGIETPLDQHHFYWMGPFVRYTHMFQTSDTQSGVLLDKRDVNFIQAGLSFSFDAPHHHQKEVVTQVVEHRVEVPVPAECPPPPPPPPPAAKVEEKVEFSEVVYFDLDSSKLRGESHLALDNVVKKLAAHPNLKLRVEGHASSEGPKLHNIKLSGDRVGAVVQYLTQHGVSPARLNGVAMGIDSPAGDNSKKEGREQNRRVEFRVNFIAVQ